MNHGYFFLIMCWMILILVHFQWMDFLWKNKDKVQLTRRWVVLIIILLIITQGVYLPLSADISINIGVILFTGSLVAYFLWRDSTGLRLQMLSVILFLGIFYAVSYEVFFIDPILMIVNPFYLLPAFFVLFLMLTTGDLKLQWLMIAGGFILGETIHKFFIYKYVTQIYIGDAEFRDQMMMGIVMMSTVSLGFKALMKLSADTLKRVFFFRRQEG